MADDDEYGGSTHLKNFLSESQSHAPGSLADSGNSMLRDRNRPDRGDIHYEMKYGKSMGAQLEPGPEQTVNRKNKGDKLK
jgi:hypothetical protein